MNTLVEKISISNGTTDGDAKSWWAERRLLNNQIIELQQFWTRNFFLCIIWSLADTHWSVTFGFEMNHIRL